MKIMRTVVILLAVCPLTAIAARSSGAETYRPWCVVYPGRDGAYTCIFTSFEQCMMTATPGTGGSCVQNPWYLRYGPNDSSARPPTGPIVMEISSGGGNGAVSTARVLSYAISPFLSDKR